MKAIKNIDCLREMVFWMGFYSFLEKTCSILRIPDGPF